MNRCNSSLNNRLLLTLFLTLAGLGGAYAPPARAQVENEATYGGRNFPIGTLRGKFLLVNSPEILLDGQPERLAPGARIRSPQNMLMMPAAITGQNLLVNYTRDAAGLVSQVWVLTPGEAEVARESAEKPLLNFWPFVANSAPRDDGRTPFDQLPKYGE